MENRQDTHIHQNLVENKPAEQNPPGDKVSRQNKGVPGSDCGTSSVSISATQDQAEQTQTQVAVAQFQIEFEQNPLPQTSLEQNKAKGVLAKAGQILGNTIFVLSLLIMAALVFSMVQSKFTGKPPTVAGHQMFIVLGGSMSPTFEVGSLAFVKPVEPQKLEVGDIITFKSTDQSELMTTHRIVGVNHEGGVMSFTTRGDANDADDALPAKPERIVGTVNMAVPYAGYLMQFGQTQKGMIALVIVPSVLIIIFELRNLFRYYAQWEAEKKARKDDVQMSKNSKTADRAT